MVFMKDFFFKKVDLKKSADEKNRQNNQAGKELNYVGIVSSINFMKSQCNTCEIKSVSLKQLLIFQFLYDNVIVSMVTAREM